MQKISDLFIIGGGINGAAIAADAAGRGLSVTLCEKNDLAAGTSSASSKLIHGGLRYLEHYEFLMVRKALKEREILLGRAPHIITPLEFVLPYENHLRPAWLIRIGLFFYDHLTLRSRLPKSKAINLRQNGYGQALQSQFKKGFSYYDCFTDDARLTVLNAISAKDHGATILTRMQFVSAKYENNLWNIQLKNIHSQEMLSYQAKVLVNASGPWVKDVDNNINTHTAEFSIELVKGSHIVVPKIYAGDFAYILQNADGRVVFVIPYQNHFTLIGTTDVNFSGNLGDVYIDANEKIYLCNIVNQYFKQSIQLKDIIWSYSGVRCLQAQHAANPSAITRDHKLILSAKKTPPLLTVVGGKITTHRQLAEEALEKLRVFFPGMKTAWTATTPLPGGDFAPLSFVDFYLQFKTKYPWLPEKVAYRYVKNYGTRVHLLLKAAHSLNDLGLAFSADLYQKEVEYLMQHEWAQTSDDILWRRTKLGLEFSKEEVEKLADWLKH